MNVYGYECCGNDWESSSDADICSVCGKDAHLEYSGWSDSGLRPRYVENEEHYNGIPVSAFQPLIKTP